MRDFMVSIRKMYYAAAAGLEEEIFCFFKYLYCASRRGEERRRFTGIRGHIPHGAFYFNMEPRLNTPSWPPGQNTLIKPWIKQKRKEEEEEWRKNGVWWRRVEKHPSSVLNS